MHYRQTRLTDQYSHPMRRDPRAELLDLTDITPAMVAQLDADEVHELLAEAYGTLMVQS